MDTYMLNDLIQLSHELGTEDYVKGGGGNGSAKDAETLWIKPSGTTMAGLSTANLVAMDRSRISTLFETPPPEDVNTRETWVKNLMQAAVRKDSAGRPSVEAPLHNSFTARFVLHTHPPAVNGMTCSRDGKEACRRLFPNALWMDFVNPGYTLAIEAKKSIAEYARRHGREPAVMFIGNHGIFVTGDTPQSVRSTYSTVMSALNGEYKTASIAPSLPVGPAPAQADSDRMLAMMSEAAGPSASAMYASGPFAVPPGPLTPDHIVYMKSKPLIADKATGALIKDFIGKNGYYPRIISTPSGVYAFGESGKAAELAMDLARDGAQILRFAAAFGGIRYMTTHACSFIENWEVEAYRRQQV